MSTAAPGDRLFVYGTLQSTAAHPLGALLRRSATLIGPGSIRARLYIVTETDADGVNHFPAALPSAHVEDRVFGEVYELTDPAPLLTELDRFEACAPGYQEPYEFLLRPVDVSMEDGGAVRALAYLYTWDVSCARHLPEGRFLEAAPEVR